MSVEAMAIALHHSKAKGAEKLVLLGIANHDGDGGAWPSIKTLAKYAGGCSPRRATELVTSLVERGEISRDINAGGLAHLEAYERPNLYHFVLKCPPSCDGTRRHKEVEEDAPRAVKKPPAKSRTPREISREAPREISHPNHPSNQPLDISIPTQVTGPVDNSRCNWNRFDQRSEHYPAPGVTGRDDWACIRCGYVTPGVPTLAQIAASLAAEANA